MTVQTLLCGEFPKSESMSQVKSMPAKISGLAAYLCSPGICQISDVSDIKM